MLGPTHTVHALHTHKTLHTHTHTHNTTPLPLWRPGGGARGYSHAEHLQHDCRLHLHTASWFLFCVSAVDLAGIPAFQACMLIWRVCCSWQRPLSLACVSDCHLRPLPQACSDNLAPCSPFIADLTLEVCCRLADAYKTGETDRLAKVDYRRFCQDMDTGEAWSQVLVEDVLRQCLCGEVPAAWSRVEGCQGSTGLHACGPSRKHETGEGRV